MNMSWRLALIVVLLSTAGFAEAGTIASPAIYWSPGQERATCTIRNVGKIAVSVEVAILTESGDALSLFPDTCNGVSLTPGTACSVTHFGIANGVAFACSATASSVKNLRGAMFIQEAGFNVNPRRSAPLR